MHNIKIFLCLAMSLCAIICFANDNDTSTKKERNFIRLGNCQYEEGRYRDSEVSYIKALELNHLSEIANFNHASALMKQSGSVQADSPQNPIIKADSIFNDLAQNSQNKIVKENSYYNLGNIAYDRQDYKKSIEMYKSTLRLNPDNDNARDNLRLAQLKLKEQEQNKNNDNKQNKDNQNNDDKNKEQKQDTNEQKQDQKDQNKNDENKEKNKNQQQQNQDSQERQKKQQQSQGISDANAEKILKTMENEENATRRKVNEMKKKEEQRNASRRQTTNQW